MLNEHNSTLTSIQNNGAQIPSKAAQNRVNAICFAYLIIEYGHTKNLSNLVKFGFELPDDSPLLTPLMQFIADRNRTALGAHHG